MVLLLENEENIILVRVSKFVPRGMSIYFLLFYLQVNCEYITHVTFTHVRAMFVTGKLKHVT